jgi:putative hydrolase
VKIIADLHTHTRYSHGKGTIAENLYAAMAKGLQAVAITDHGPRSGLFGIGEERMEAARREVADLNRRAVGTRVLLGMECNIVSAGGDLDLPPEKLDRLDIVLAGLHPGVRVRTFRDGWVLTGRNLVARVSTSVRRKARTSNTKALVEAVLTKPIDVVTHPGWGFDIDTVELARACARRGTAMEINSRHGHMTVEYCRLAARAGARFAIDSDAHRPEDVGNVASGLEVARAARLKPEQVVNSDYERFERWLSERRRPGRARRRRPGPETTTWSDWAYQPGGQE